MNLKCKIFEKKNVVRNDPLDIQRLKRNLEEFNEVSKVKLIFTDRDIERMSKYELRGLTEWLMINVEHISKFKNTEFRYYTLPKDLKI